MTRKVRRRGSRSKATLEWIVVVAIVALLAGIAIPLQRKYDARARVGEAREQLPAIVEAARAWALEHRDRAGHPRWPSSLEDLGIAGSGHFEYEITAGASARADDHALRVEARGNPRRGLSGVTLSVLVKDVDAPAFPIGVTRP